MIKVLVDTMVSLNEQIELQQAEVLKAQKTLTQLIEDRSHMADMLDSGRNEGTLYVVDKLALGYVIIRKKAVDF
jgi:hypothetical protein